MKAAHILLITLSLALSGASSAADVVTQTITANELSNRISSNTAPLILDVRTPKEFKRGHVPGALNIPHDELKDRLSELGIEKSQEVVVYCRSGRRASHAETLLKESGYTHVRDLTGHWNAWPSK